MLTRASRIALIVLEAFMGLAGVAGGIGLIAGFGAPPADLLAGSPFSSYLIPGLALSLLVGGGALVGAALLLARRPLGPVVAALSGAAVIVFLLVEVAVIGSPPGSAQGMQLFFFVYGVVVLLLAWVAWRAVRR